MWWLQSAKRLNLPLMASWYLGPALLVAGLHGVHSLRGAAAVVAVVGVVDTLLFLFGKKLSPLMAALSVLGHVAVFLPYLHTSRCTTPFATTFVHSIGLLLAVFTIYAIARKWPYNLSPAVTLAMGLTIAFTSS